MSDALFPTLAGLTWEFKRVPMYKTTIKEAVSGREYRDRRMNSPRYTYKATYSFLRDGRGGQQELRTMLGFFNARSGSFDSWRFNDPDDNAVTGQVFGTGDSYTHNFQLLRALGGNTEPVYAINGTPALYQNGTLMTAGADYTVDAFGLVHWPNAPALGVVLSWTGAFHWRCRFVQDQLEFSKFAWRLWSLKTCDFITLKPPF